MSLETILLPSGSTYPQPRSDIYVDKLMYNDIISNASLRFLTPNDSSSTVATQNTAVLQSVITLGGNILLPTGLFYINAPLIMSVNYTWLRGQGKGLTILKLVSGTNGSMLSLTGTGSAKLSGCTVSDLTLDYGAPGNSNGACVNMIACDNCYITNIKLYNVYNGISTTYAGSNRCTSNTIENIEVQYATNYGLNLQAFDNGTVLANSIEYPVVIGILAAGCLETSIADNYIFRSNGAGISIQSSGNIDVSNNYIFRTGYDGIKVSAATYGGYVENNVVQFTSQNVLGSYGTYITGNSIGSSVSNNAYYEDSTAINDSFTGPNNVVYIAKTITNTAGIHVDSGSNGAIITDNIFATVITSRIVNASAQTVVKDTYPSNIDEYCVNSLKSVNSQSFVSNDGTSGKVAISTVGTAPCSVDIKGATASQITLRQPLNASTPSIALYSNNIPQYGLTTAGDFLFSDSAFTKELLAIPIATGGLKFNNQGSGVISVLNYYSQDTFTPYCSDGQVTVQQSGDVILTRIGRMVTMVWRDLQVNATAKSNFTMALIPAQFRPSTYISNINYVSNGSLFSIGCVIINTDGTINFRFAIPTATVTGTYTFLAWSVTWSV
jgi:parallel beta-helix repeat protein